MTIYVDLPTCMYVARRRMENSTSDLFMHAHNILSYRKAVGPGKERCNQKMLNHAPKFTI